MAFTSAPEAPHLSGSLYLVAGPEPTASDLYRLRGGLRSSERLTSSPPFFGVGHLAAGGGRVAVLIGNPQRIEELVDGRLPGRTVVRRGFAFAFSDRGELAYVLPPGNDGDVAVLDRNGRQIARRHVGGALIEPMWARHGLLAAISYSAGRDRFVINPGARQRVHRIPRTPLSMSVDGRVAYTLHGRLLIRSLTWNVQRRFKTLWRPLTWSPSGATLLVTRDRGTRLALMNPKTGKLATLGHIDGGSAAAAAWTSSS